MTHLRNDFPTRYYTFTFQKNEFVRIANFRAISESIILSMASNLSKENSSFCMQNNTVTFDPVPASFIPPLPLLASSHVWSCPDKPVIMKFQAASSLMWKTEISWKDYFQKQVAQYCALRGCVIQFREFVLPLKLWTYGMGSKQASRRCGIAAKKVVQKRVSLSPSRCGNKSLTRSKRFVLMMITERKMSFCREAIKRVGCKL